MDSNTAGRQRPRKRNRLASILAVLGIIAALAALGWWLGHRPAGSPGGGAGGGGPGMGGPGMGPGGGGGGGGRGRPATTVGTAKVETQSIPVIIEALGTVVPAATVTVRPQVSGVIAEIRFKEGQTVKRGDVLAVIDRRPFQIALAQAEGQLQRDLAEFDNAKLTLERYKTLQKQDSIADQDVDTQKASVKQFEGTIASDRANVSAAKLNLDYCEIKAPQDGRVGLRVIDAGNYIGAGDAAGIAVITQVSPADVEFTVPQDQVSDINRRSARSAELPVTALDRTRSKELAQGRFTTLDNVVNVETGTVRAKARFDNSDYALFPSQFVNVRLTLNTLEDALVVPVSAVRNGADGDFVYVLGDEHKVALRKVKRGQLAGDRVQILRGVNAGETVITEGGDRLKDGASVTLPGDKPASGDRKSGGAGADKAKGERRHRRENREDSGAAAGAGTATDGKPAEGRSGESPAHAPSKDKKPGADDQAAAGGEPGASPRGDMKKTESGSDDNPGNASGKTAADGDPSGKEAGGRWHRGSGEGAGPGGDDAARAERRRHRQEEAGTPAANAPAPAP